MTYNSKEPSAANSGRTEVAASDVAEGRGGRTMQAGGGRTKDSARRWLQFVYLYPPSLGS